MLKRLPGLAIIVLCLSCLPFVAAQEDALRQEALGLNDFMILGDTDAEQRQSVDEKVQDLLRDADHAKKLLATAAKMTGPKETPFTYSAAFLLGALARKLRDVESGQLFYYLCVDKAKKVQSSRKLQSAYFEIIGLQIDSHEYANAEKVAKEFLNLQGDKDLARYQVNSLQLLARIIAFQGRIKEAFKLHESQLRAFPKSVEVQRTQAWLLQYDGQYDKAAAIYERLLADVSSDVEKLPLHQDLGDLYSDIGNVDKATEHLQWLLQCKPDEPRYNYGLGFAWADAGRNLDVAEQLIRKALARAPDQPPYLDSLGWVLYKKKQFAEAKECFVKAIRNPDGRYAEIYDHLAETHLALGEKDDAISAWKKAMQIAGTSKREQQRKADIERKLKEQQE